MKQEGNSINFMKATCQKPKYITGDKAYESDPLEEELYRVCFTSSISCYCAKTWLFKKTVEVAG